MQRYKTLADMVDSLEISRKTLRKHIDEGACPGPDCVAGHSFFFSEEAEKKVLEYWVGRRRWSKIITLQVDPKKV